ncbi:MAG: VC0807 family protein [Akkermansia sp.]
MSSPKQSSSLTGILLNVIIPVVILDYCSGGSTNILARLPEQKLWELGPLWAMILALSLPIGYGLKSLFQQKRFDIMSIVGMSGVILTGVISLFVIGDHGQIHWATPWLFASKEAFIPLILATAVLVSASTPTPLINAFLYNPELFDISRIEQAIKTNKKEHDYQRLLMHSTWILTGTLVCSSIANFFLSLFFMTPILQFPEKQQQVEYNIAIGQITWWGFLIIGVPLLIAMGITLIYLLKSLGKLTSLSRTEILLK